jgi:hypothetical protein
LPRRGRRWRITDVVSEIEQETARRRAETGRVPPGPDVIRRQNPHKQPQMSKLRVAGAALPCGLRTGEKRSAGYAGFLATFREAAEKWRTGDRTVIFPVGGYPSALPFVSG